MLFTQVVIPVIIVAGVCFWAGMRWERERRNAQMKQGSVLVRLPKNYDWRM